MVNHPLLATFERDRAPHFRLFADARPLQLIAPFHGTLKDDGDAHGGLSVDADARPARPCDAKVRIARLALNVLSFTGCEVDCVVDAHIASLEGTHEIDRAEGLLDFNGRDADLKPVDVDKRLLISARCAHRNHAALGDGLVRLADRVSELTRSESEADHGADRQTDESEAPTGQFRAVRNWVTM